LPPNHKRRIKTIFNHFRNRHARISRAYNIVKAEQNEKDWQFFKEYQKLTEEERKKRALGRCKIGRKWFLFFLPLSVPAWTRLTGKS
jgi:hypothetical protein